MENKPLGNVVVTVERVAGAPAAAVANSFGRFPRIEGLLRSCEKVFIKVNAVYFHPHLHTSLDLIEAAVEYIKRVDSKKRIYLMENCSQGNFSRLCFSTIGLDALAKKLRVYCLYLDEEKSVKVMMRDGKNESEARFPQILYENLIVGRDKNLYLNMPVLKAHCQTQMTAGIKNQMGLLYDKDKARHHNHRLHQKLVDLLAFIRPDFTLVDALKVVARGPIPAVKYLPDLLNEKDVIVAGEDVVAVDAVCAKILGYDPVEVKHLSLAAAQGFGEGNLQNIRIEGQLPTCKERIPWEYNPHLPDSMKIVVGKGGACYEGCLGHLEQVAELLVNERQTPHDFDGLPLTIVTGRNLEDDQFNGLREPIIVLGKCACKEALERVRKQYIHVEPLNTCGRCDNIIALLAENLNVSVLDLSPLSRLEIYRQFLTGRLHGLRYKIPR
ncbi:MAG: DUF362 domain-containing protein [Candidatus Abyssobacteria bacterium SURF_5]|uniref:DUF362 domain-containing protein n=1 Tax=Abyssobacteria bacterium (strain SURF_5) TaxID=2093360 RepID=A0A3A4NUC8_ABYX5|nr:MAG: DUF362 domain-containing protein [Candidatus Abyssubacteria bacterium SURF_5]